MSKKALDLFNALPMDERNRVALTQDEYGDLKSSDKGDVRADLVAWSRWSPPYKLTAGAINDDQLGVPILSPGPRRYFQLKAEFASENLQSARALGPLAFTVSNPPLTERIISEVVPRQVELGVPGVVHLCRPADQDAPRRRFGFRRVRDCHARALRSGRDH